jgi:hypothetical protein
MRRRSPSLRRPAWFYVVQEFLELLLISHENPLS